MHLLRKRPKIVATILAKDEEDILDHMIKHHINVGIEAFIVTNNRSSDKTRDIAASYKEVVKIFDEMDNTHHQEAHVTKMARYACKLQPEWIVHFDADEFWSGFEFLDTVKENGVASTIAYIHPPVTPEVGFNPQEQRFYLDMKEIQASMEESKVIHRPNENIVIQHGNHWMDNVEGPILRTEEVYRHHYPLRCYQQMVVKAVIGHKAMISRGAYCGRWGNWHDLYEAGKLEEEFNRILGNWNAMIQTKEIDKTLLSEMVQFYAGGPDGMERVLTGLEKITPEIKEWVP